MDWEISRQEQNFIYLKRKEGKYGKTIIKNEEKCRNEEIIHENMKKFCEESKNVSGSCFKLELKQFSGL